MGRCPPLLGLVVLTLGALAVTALARRPAPRPPTPSGGGLPPARGGRGLGILPGPAFHARFSLN
jgi:hypothetical protein